MLKSYDELVKIDVTPFCQIREETEKLKGGKEKIVKIPYLPWTKCIELLRQNGATKVYYEPIINEKTGSTLFYTDLEFDNGKVGDAKKVNRCYEVRVRIVIDEDIDFVYNFPLMNGKNAVCDNSLNQLRVASAQARAFVKGVAIRTGLGFHLWCKDDEMPTNDNEPLSPLLLLQLQEQFGEAWTHTISKHKNESADALAQKIGVADQDDMRMYYKTFTKLYNLFVAMQDL